MTPRDNAKPQLILRPTLLVCLGSTGRKIGKRILQDNIIHLAESDQEKLMVIFLDMEDDQPEEFYFLQNYPKITVRPLWLAIDNEYIKAFLQAVASTDPNRAFLTLGNERPYFTPHGAGAIRLNGQGAIWSNLQQVSDTISDLVKKARNAFRQDMRYINVMLTGFSGGGTGSGSLLATAILLRGIMSKQNLDAQISIHSVLPERRDEERTIVDQRRNANAMALLTEAMGLCLASKRDSTPTFSFGKENYHLIFPVINEVFIINDANMERDEVIMVLAADMAARLQTNHGVGNAESTAAANQLAAIQISQISQLYPLLAASSVAEIVFPIEDVGKAFAARRVARLLDEVARRRPPADASRSETTDERISMGNLQLEYDSFVADEWLARIIAFKRQATDRVMQEVRKLDEDLEDLLTSIGQDPATFPISLARIYTEISYRVSSYGKLTALYESRWKAIAEDEIGLVPPQDEIDMRYREIMKEGNVQRRQTRAIAYWHQMAENPQRWCFAKQKAEAYAQAFATWSSVKDALKVFYDQTALQTPVFRSKGDTSSIAQGALAQQHRFRKSIFAPDLYPQGLFQDYRGQIRRAVDTYEANAVSDLQLPARWFGQLIEQLRQPDVRKAREVQFALQELLGSEAQQEGWTADTADYLRSVRYLDVLKQVCTKENDFKRTLDLHIAWLQHMADDLVALLNIPQTQTTKATLEPRAWLTCAWNDDPEKRLLAAFAANHAIGGSGRINCNIQLTDNPAKDLHRLVLMYTVHGIDLTDIQMFRPTERYTKALLELEQRWSDAGRNGEVPTLFTCDYSKDLVMGTNGVLERLRTGWATLDRPSATAP